jgi:Flp pilus assembly pilin Flp
MQKKNGYTLLEYAMLILVVVVALIGMQLYLKRSLAGKWKQAVDSVGFGRQY